MVTLVTGSTGFFGHHLVRKLLVDERRRVRCLARKNSDISTLEKLGAEIVFGDITESMSLNAIMTDVDVVYHTAGHIENGFRQPSQKLYQVNVEGTNNLLQVAAKHNIEKFVYVSSMAAVGSRNSHALVKEDVSCAPDTPYGRSKLDAEALVLNYFKNSELPVVIIRPPMIYGRGEKRNFLMLTRAVKNKKFMFVGNGLNLTSLCYVDNLIDATLLVEKRGLIGSIYHVADSTPYTWKELIIAIQQQLGVDHKIMHIPIPIANVGAFFFEGLSKISSKSEPPLHNLRVKTLSDNFAFDITKARNDLGYLPKVKLDKGLRTTLEWYEHEGLLS